jgi:hypothetical protein
MYVEFTEQLEKSLALGVACGRSVRHWAKRHSIDVDDAYGRAGERDFRQIVEGFRLRVVERVLGKMTAGIGIAVDQLVQLCKKSKSDGIRLSASRALVDIWLKVHAKFSQDVRLKELEATMHQIKKQKAEQEAWITSRQIR